MSLIPLDTLLKLVDAVPSIRAIKDWCNDPMLHEKHIRTPPNAAPSGQRPDDA